MKTVIQFLTAILLVTTILFCSEGQSHVELSRQINEATSPTNRLLLEKDQTTLKEIIQNDVNRMAGKVTDFEILETIPTENANLLATDIKIRTSDGLESNVILVEVKKASQRSGGNTCYTVSCTGDPTECPSCSAETTDEGDGTLTHSCSNACCDIAINEVDCAGHFSQNRR